MTEHIPDIDDERLHRRIDFLTSRANAHLNSSSEDMRHRAAAAILLRDAASAALLIGRNGEARNLLGRSGKYFLELGLTVGASLLALGDPLNARKQIDDYADVMEGVRRQWGREDARSRETPRRAMAEVARGSPRQMLSLMQAEWLLQEIEYGRHPSTDDVEVRGALERTGGYPVGATGLSVRTYVDMAQWMSDCRGNPVKNIPTFVARGLGTIAANRAEYIRSAMMDRYHWRMLARPSELLDLDTLILCSIALGAGMEYRDIKRHFEVDVPLESAPLNVARQLRGDRGTRYD